MKEITAVIQPFMQEKVLDALAALPALPGLTVTPVTGWGRTRGDDAKHTHVVGPHALVRKVRLDVVVPDALAARVVRIIVDHAHTGRPGDGKVFVRGVEQVVRIRTGEEDDEGLQ